LKQLKVLWLDGTKFQSVRSKSMTLFFLATTSAVRPEVSALEYRRGVSSFPRLKVMSSAAL
jgi:hypothetical protein